MRVLVSLLLALTIIPLLAEQFLTAADASRGRACATRGARSLGAACAAPRRARGHATNARSAGRCGTQTHDRRRSLVLVGSASAPISLVGTGFLPDMDEGAFVLDYWSPGGTSLTETDRQLHTIERILAATPEITGTSRRTGCRARTLRDGAEPRRHVRAADADRAAVSRHLRGDR